MGQVNLIDVDAATRHAKDARGRARTARRLQAVEHVVEPQTPPHVSWIDWFGHRLELPEWGKLRMTENGSRFSMSYAVVSIMVALLGIVIAATVTVGLAVAGAAIWIIIGITELKTNVEQVAKTQAAQEVRMDTQQAYINKAIAEQSFIRGQFPERQRASVEQWNKDNPVEKFSQRQMPSKEN